MLITRIKDNYSNSALNSTNLEKIIKETYRVGIETKIPLDIQEVSRRIGERPSLLLCAMLASQPNCSTFGVKCLIEVLAGIAENQPIIVSELDFNSSQLRPFNFTLATNGFLNEEFEPINENLEEGSNSSVSFIFTPEHRVPKLGLRENPRINGSFDLDLKIDMFMTIFAGCPNKNKFQYQRINESIPIASVVVEFDGPTHLHDEQVRKDKVRDSMVQGQGYTVFRIQMPYQHQGEGSKSLNQRNLDALIEGQIQDIRNHFQNRLFKVVDTNFLLKSLTKKNLANKLFLSK